MREDIDYKNYDPANFTKDHPDDQSVLHAVREAEKLSDKIVSRAPNGSPIEQEREVSQDFFHLETDLVDKQGQADKIEQLQHKHEFSQSKTDGIYKTAIERIEATRRPEGQVAAWQGVKKEVDNARASVASDPEYLKQRDQLTHFQAARTESIGHEVNRVAEKTINEVSRESGRYGEATGGAPQDKANSADQSLSLNEEDKARLQRAQAARKLATAFPITESDRSPEFEAGR